MVLRKMFKRLGKVWILRNPHLTLPRQFLPTTKNPLMINTTVEAPDIQIGGGGLSMHGIGRLKFTVELPFTQKITRGRGVRARIDCKRIHSFNVVSCLDTFPALSRLQVLGGANLSLSVGGSDIGTVTFEWWLALVGTWRWLICTTKLYLFVSPFHSVHIPASLLE